MAGKHDRCAWAGDCAMAGSTRIQTRCLAILERTETALFQLPTGQRPSQHTDQRKLTSIQNNKKLGPRCTTLLEGDPPEPPYFYKNWGSGIPTAAPRLMKPRSLVQCDNHGSCHQDIDTALQFTLTSLVLIAAMALAVAGMLIQIGRRKVRTVPPFTSSARSGHSHVQITRYDDSGSKTVSAQGMIVKEKPEEDQLAHLERHMHHSQDHGQDLGDDADWYFSNNTSAETLVAPWKDLRKPSNVSVLDKSANEKHEGLIELEVAGKTKAFFKPSTGEFIHLKPWKSTHHSGSDSDSDERRFKAKAEEKGSVYRVLGQMFTGGVSWAAGKKVEKVLVEGLQKEGVIWGEEGLRHRRQPPQRAGDCLAGEVTNEWPSGRPTLV